MNARTALPFVAVVSALALVAAFFCRPLPTTITRANADRIRPGMKLVEVEKIVGEPRDEVSGRNASPFRISGSGIFGNLSPPHERRRWLSESHLVTVDTTTAGDVLAVEVSDHRFDSTWDYLHWRAHRVLGLAPDVPTPVEGVYIRETRAVHRP